MAVVVIKVAQTAVSCGPRFSIVMTLQQYATMYVDVISFHRSRIDDHKVPLNTIPGRADFTHNVSTGMTRVGDGHGMAFATTSHG
jgi:hypothetical protein